MPVDKKTRGESFIKGFFAKQFEINCIPIHKRSEKTPDYFLEKGNEIIAVCEVKDIEEHTHNNLCTNTSFGRYSCPAKDVERIGHKIQEAHPQLKSYCEPKVLAIVDFDNMHDPHALLKAALTGRGGQRIIVTETMQGTDTDVNSYHVARGNIKGKLKNIDLYLMINQRTEKCCTAVFLNNHRGKDLQELFIKCEAIVLETQTA